MADPIRWESKDPDDVVVRGFNWSPRRWGNDTISNISTSIVSGTATVVSSAVATVPGARPGQGTIHWISGGSEGADTTIRLRATTALGRQEDQTMVIKAETR